MTISHRVPLQNLAEQLVGQLVIHLAPQIAQLLVHQLHDMEVVERECGLRQAFHHSCVAAASHVVGHGCDLGLGLLQLGKERLQGCLAAFLQHRHDVQQMRKNWTAWRGVVRRSQRCERLVFIDESAVTTSMLPL